MTSLGLEWGAKYTLTGPDGAVVVFNDSTDPNFVGVLSPESSGLDAADVREDATDATEEDGGHHGDFFEGRRPVVLQGTVIANTAALRNERIGKLKRATRALRRDATLEWEPVGGAKVELKLRRQQPLRFTKGFTKDFQVGMIAADIFPKAKTKQTKSVTIETQKKFVTKFPNTQTGIHWGGGGEEETINFEPATSGIEAEDGFYTKGEPLATPSQAITLTSSNYGFAIPGTATILGIEAAVKRRSSGAGGAKDYKIRIINNTTIGTTNKAVTIEDWPTVAAWKTYGGKSDLWGISPTPTSVNKNGSNEFGFGLNQQRGSGFNAGEKGEVDAFKMTIYYQEASAPSNTVSCTNNGDTTAWPTVTIKGFIENPVIKNTTTGEEIKLEGVVPEGQSLVIDFKNHTIKLNGSYAYYFLNFASSKWWGIEPGANTISVSGEYATATAKLEVAWQDTFL